MDSLCKNKVLNLIDSFISDNIISPDDLSNYKSETTDKFEPEAVRRAFEQWYIALGIEDLTGEEFHLELPYFTRDEIMEAYENNEMVLCVPKGVDRKILAELFHLKTWAIEDELVTKKTESNDFWYFMKNSVEPEYLDSQGREVKKVFEKDGKLQLSLERYMVFIARMRTVYHRCPDLKTKTWIVNGRYEKKAMLIAGFDSKRKFSTNAWMPNFKSPYVGGRYVRIVDHHYI